MTPEQEAGILKAHRIESVKVTETEKGICIDGVWYDNEAPDIQGLRQQLEAEQEGGE